MSDTHHSLYINGRWDAGHGQSFASLNPSDGSSIWQGNAANAQDVDSAIRAAREALDAWSDRSPTEREAICRVFAAQLDQHRDALAQTISQETGKPLWETKTEVAAMIGKIDISVRACQQRTGDTETPGTITQAIRHKPHGVVAVFGPYNFPGHLPNGHIVPALLAGNCIVFKPSEQTPLVAQRTVELWHAAGLPAGVLNLVQGERDTGMALAAHAGIDGLFFTGSARTGRVLARQLSDRPGTILALEMGGNNPLIVTPTSDRRAALHAVIQSAYLSAGQRCTCARRLLLPAGEWGDEFINDLADAVKSISVGRWDDDPQPFMGPLISAQAASAIINAQDRLTDLGASPVVLLQALPLGDAFVSPGLIDVSAVENLPDEEYFGPLLQVMRYRDLDHAIELANRTRYGLSAGLLSDSETDYRKFWRRIRAGIVNWNRPTNGAASSAPFGGVGDSGNHRPSAYYAADYCAYPVASLESPQCELPDALPPGLKL